MSGKKQILHVCISVIKGVLKERIIECDDVFGRIERHNQQCHGAQQLQDRIGADEQERGGRFSETENNSDKNRTVRAGENPSGEIPSAHDGIQPAFFNYKTFALLDVLQDEKKQGENRTEKQGGE